jgi:Transglycosylase SLT domain
MVDLAPKLNSGVAFNQPVQTPNAMGAIADLFNFGVSTMQKSASGDKMTADEEFAVAVRQFEDEKGATFQWDRKGMREFIFKYPQFTDQAKGFGENLGVMVASPQEAARDSLTEWAKTPEGIEAAAKASQFEDPAEGDAYMAQRMTEQKVQEAEIAKLKRNTEKLTLEGTLETEQWKALAPAQKTAVDTAIDVYFKDIFDEVTTKGTTIQISPEQQEMLGISYNSVSLDNLPAVLYDIKKSMETRARSTFMNTWGSDSLPSEDWNKQVFASIDNLITGAEKFDTPEEKAAFIKGLTDIEAHKKLDDAGLAVSVAIFKSLPSEAAALLYPQLTGMTGKLAEVLNDNGSIANSGKLKVRIQDLGKTDANSLAEETIKVIESGGLTPEFFTAFQEAAKRGGHNVVDAASYKAIVGNNIDKIKTSVSSDPAFREEFGQWITSDIQQTISAVQSSLPAGLVISTEGNKFIVTAGEDFDWAGFDAINKVRVNGGQQPVSIQQYIQDNLPSSQGGVTSNGKQMAGGLSVDTLNQKVATLGLLGEFGKEVQGALGILNTDKKATNSKPTRGAVPRGRGRGRNVGAELGIDFAGYEAEAGLPSGYLNTMAIIESGGNPSAQNDNSTAGGLFQQIDSNAAAYGVTDRFDPVQSTEGAVAFAQDNTVALARVLGREPTGGELYLAHQQGPGGATKLLSNPSALAVDLVGADAVRLNGGTLDMTAQEFANIWINKYEKIASGGVGPAGAPVSSLPTKDRGTPSVRSSSASVDSASLQGASNSPVQALGGTVEAFQSPEVQQIVEKAQSAPDEALKLAKEVLAKPIDPMIKSLIEALVKIGERA